MPFDHKIGLENTRDLLGILLGNGVRAWVQDGTLLGLVRDGKPIDWDHDTDTGAMIEDFNPKAITALAAAGFVLKDALGVFTDGLQHRWVRDGVKTDIFWYYQNDDGSMWHAAYVAGARQYRFTYPPPFDVAPLDTSVGMMPAPDPPEDFLVRKYGRDWRTPRRDWHFARSPKNSSTK